jgi:outer membrane protein TolC
MRFAALCLALPAAAVAIAQTAEKRLDIHELIAEATLRNPEILAAQKKYEAAAQRPAQERSLPDPMLSFGWNSNGNPLPGAGLGTWPTANIGVMASQELPYPGKLRLRGEIAGKEVQAEAEQYRATALGVISRLEQAYHRLHHAYVMQEILTRNKESLRSLLRATEARYSVGRTPQTDVFKVQTQLTLVETRLAQIERDKRARAAEINSLLNRRYDAGLARPAEMEMNAPAFTLDELLLKARDAAPTLGREQRMIERAGSALNLARKDRYPDFTINGGYFNMGSMPPMYMFRADMRLPVHGAKTRAEITERTYEVAEAQRSYEASARALEYRIRDDYAAAETALKLATLYSQTVLPQARLTVESSLAAYEAGQIDLAAVLSNQVAAFDYEMSYHEQMQEYHLALARLEEDTGVELNK